MIVWVGRWQATHVGFYTVELSYIVAQVLLASKQWFDWSYTVTEWLALCWLASSKGNASIDQSTLLKSLSELSKEIKDLKQEINEDFSEFKNKVKTTMKEDLSEFKANALWEMQNQNANIAEAQAQIVDLESVCLQLKDTLITTVKLNREMQDKITNLESHSRGNNLQIKTYSYVIYIHYKKLNICV